MRYLAILGVLVGSALCAAEADYPNQFTVRQDDKLRMFRVLDGEKPLGAVVSSDYGQLDFYDSERQKRWTNFFDHLYDKGLNCIASVKVASDDEFYERSTLIQMFAADKKLLAKVQAEGGDNCFIFRDAETEKAFAIGLLKWLPTRTWNLAFLDTYIQEWSVFVVDRPAMEAKGLSCGFLVWALLKHSQKHMPDPKRVPYEETLPAN